MFDEKLKEGVEYFERMLKAMPDDRTTLEFLAVAYAQLGEKQNAAETLVALARVLLAEGDVDSAAALLPRLEECEYPVAKMMAMRIKAMTSEAVELVPETVKDDESAPQAGIFATACEREALLAEKLEEPEVAAHLRALPDNGRQMLVSALSVLEKEHPEVCDRALGRLAEEYGEMPVPVDAFEPQKKMVAKLGAELMKIRGVIPFAVLGKFALVATLSPHDRELKSAIAAALGQETRFYLAEPRLVEAALAKIFPPEEPNA